MSQEGKSTVDQKRYSGSGFTAQAYPIPNHANLAMILSTGRELP